MLLRRIQLTHNLKFDGVLNQLSTRRLNPLTGEERDFAVARIEMAAAKGLVSKADKQANAGALPGVRSGDAAKRSIQPRARATCVRFAPTATTFAVATEEGVLVYRLGGVGGGGSSVAEGGDDDDGLFGSLALSKEVSLSAARDASQTGAHSLALALASRLGSPAVVRETLMAVPVDQVASVAAQLAPSITLPALFRALVAMLDGPAAAHLEFALRWLVAILSSHGPYIAGNRASFLAPLRALRAAVSASSDALLPLCEGNERMLMFLSETARVVTDAVDDSDQRSTKRQKTTPLSIKDVL